MLPYKKMLVPACLLCTTQRLFAQIRQFIVSNQGDGAIHLKCFFESASVAGMKHYFVEHDMPKDAFASITTSFKNLQKIV